jgi:hypothetical protein
MGELSRDGEVPIFTIRADNKHAVSVLLDYMSKCSVPSQVNSIIDAAIVFSKYGILHPDKLIEPGSSYVKPVLRISYGNRKNG